MASTIWGSKFVVWAGSALVVATVISPESTTTAFNALKSGMQSRPGLLKKRNATTSGGTTTTATTPTTSTGTVTPTTTANGFPELSTIMSDFDPLSELNRIPIPATSAPDVGAFRFLCGPGQIQADDPIVYPGQPGKSHLHQYFGNTSANANSTYQSLRSSGQSTCMSPVNRSGYWIPALLDGRGNVVRPDVVGIYYKRWPVGSTRCNSQGGYPTKYQVEAQACVGLPNGLRFIFGFNMLNPGQAPTGSVRFMCLEDMTNADETMTQALNRCRATKLPTTHLLARMEAPNCWDGKNLDSADHRSHVAYGDYGDWGFRKCPTTHPYMIPEFTMTTNYTMVSSDDTTLWRYSSDSMVAGASPGTTFHGDWFGAWDPTIQAMWTDNCINKNLNCSGGDLGNGYQMKMYSGFTQTANPRLVPIPS